MAKKRALTVFSPVEMAEVQRKKILNQAVLMYILGMYHENERCPNCTRLSIPEAINRAIDTLGVSSGDVNKLVIKARFSEMINA